MPALVAVILGACASPGAVADSELVVYAAASLRPVFDDLEAAWALDHPGLDLVASFDASSALAARIAEGAPADVLVSADTAQPERLVAEDLAAEQPIPFATNRLALVVREGSRVVQASEDLAGPGVRIVAAAPEAPLSQYTERLLGLLAARSADPGAWLAAVELNTVSREDNARAALAKVEVGEADAAIVYATDAAAADGTRRIAIPEAAAVPVTYAAVALDGARPEAATAFVEWLAGPRAREVLARAGFGPPP